MLVDHVPIADFEIWFTAYNPRNALSKLYCAFAVAKAKEALRGVDLCEVHAWIRGRFPQAREMLDVVEAGGELPPEVRPGEYPLTPGQERLQVPIVAAIQRGAGKKD